jgi:hypothetical protein
VYKHIKPALNHKLIEYESGTREKNEKRLLARKEAAGFLPHPRLVLKRNPEIGQKVKYVDPFTGEWKKVERSRDALPFRQPAENSGRASLEALHPLSLFRPVELDSDLHPRNTLKEKTMVPSQLRHFLDRHETILSEIIGDHDRSSCPGVASQWC